MKLKARLAYGVLLQAEIADGSPLRMLNVNAILAQASSMAKPMLLAALTGAFGKLAALGVKVTMSDARLDLTAED